jgi:hypothetical protein
MKTLITTVAIATPIATPVFAQTRHSPPQARTQVQKHSTNPNWDV